MDDETPGSLSARWRTRSLAAGWAMPEDWWTPAVDQAIRAIHAGGAVNRGHDLTRACSALGGARARAGVGIAEGMNDLAALFRELGKGDPPFVALRSFAAGWTEASFAPITELRCEDPLTGLMTAAYLRTRLGELYRESGPAVHRLVVAEPYHRLAELSERLATVLSLAQCVRETFTEGQTLALLGPVRVGALTRACCDLTPRVARLRSARIGYGRQPRVTVLRLPGRYDDALGLLTRLGA